MLTKSLHFTLLTDPTAVAGIWSSLWLSTRLICDDTCTMILEGTTATAGEMPDVTGNQG